MSTDGKFSLTLMAQFILAYHRLEWRHAEAMLETAEGAAILALLAEQAARERSACREMRAPLLIHATLMNRIDWHVEQTQSVDTLLVVIERPIGRFIYRVRADDPELADTLDYEIPHQTSNPTTLAMGGQKAYERWALDAAIEWIREHQGNSAVVVPGAGGAR